MRRFWLKVALVVIVAILLVPVVIIGLSSVRTENARSYDLGNSQKVHIIEIVPKK